MTITLTEIIEMIEKKNPMNAKKIRKDIDLNDPEFMRMVGRFYSKYEQYLKKINRSLEYAVDSYLQVVSDMFYEQLRFMQSGKYSCSSFSEVKQRVYDNGEVMDYYMNGLAVSQFLWRQHYEMLSFFSRNIAKYGKDAGSYLEIGAGHGLYVAEAIDQLSSGVHVDVLDISTSSIEMTKFFVEKSDKIRFINQDIFDYHPDTCYDLVAMGEVLEHVEQPRHLLRRLFEIMNENAILFITVPVNSPAIDHIYLFSSSDQVRSMIEESGFTVVEDLAVCEKDVPENIAEKERLPLMYAAFAKKEIKNA